MIQTISCKTQYGPCSQEDNEVINKIIGKNLFFIKSVNYSSQLEHIYINKKAFIEKIFPSKIAVFIEKRKAIVAIEQKLQNKFYLIDADGRVIGLRESSFLPTLIADDFELKEGEFVKSELISAVKILYLLYKSQSIMTGVVEAGTLTILIDTVTVNFPLDKDPQILVGALQLIISRSRIEGNLPKMIDLRYVKPVLNYGEDQSASRN